MAEHGTRTMYVHYGCRCDECCKAEHRQYIKRTEGKVKTRTASKWNGLPKIGKSASSQAAEARRRKAIRERPRAHTSLINWREIADSFGMKCAECGRTVDPSDTWINESGRVCFGGAYPTVDHIVAVKNGGCDTFDNVQLLCKHCNSKKGARAEVA